MCVKGICVTFVSTNVNYILKMFHQCGIFCVSLYWYFSRQYFEIESPQQYLVVLHNSHEVIP
jgi:hypothetical protein